MRTELKHEIRTVMNTLLGSLELNSEATSSSEERENTRNALGAARELAALVEELLTGSRSPVSRVPIGIRPSAVTASDGSGTILVVDDNTINLRIVCKLLTKRGYAVTAAGGGREAVDHFLKTRFDLVLMDLLMPDVDGFQAARLMREAWHGGGRGVPILALSAVEGGEGLVDFDGMLPKPFKADDLLAAVRSILGAKPAEPALRAPESPSREASVRLTEDLRIFLLEAHELADRMEQGVMTLERGHGDSGSVQDLFRTFHTMKGNSGLFELPRLEAICHKGETLLDLLRAGELRVDGEAVSLLLKTADAVRASLVSLEREGREVGAGYEALGEEIGRFVENRRGHR